MNFLVAPILSQVIGVGNCKGINISSIRYTFSVKFIFIFKNRPVEYQRD